MTHKPMLLLAALLLTLAACGDGGTTNSATNTPNTTRATVTVEGNFSATATLEPAARIEGTATLEAQSSGSRRATSTPDTNMMPLGGS